MEHFENKRKTTKKGEVFFIYVYGPPGSGKSCFADNYFKSLDLKYDHSCLNSKLNMKVDNNTEAFFIDEYYPTNFSIRNLNTLADEANVRHEVKGDYQLLEIETVVMVSNFELEELTPNITDMYRNTINRRINIYIRTDFNENGCLEVILFSKNRTRHGRVEHTVKIVLDDIYLDFECEEFKSAFQSLVKANIDLNNSTNDKFKERVNKYF